MMRHTPESIKQMLATRARNKRLKAAPKPRRRRPPRELPIVEIRNGNSHDAAEFAAFMAAAWKIYQEGR